MPEKLHTFLLDESRGDLESFRKPFDDQEQLQVVGLCTRLRELQPHIQCSRIDVMIVNLDTPDEKTGPAAVQRIAELNPRCGIIGVSKNRQSDAIISAMRSGCWRFVHWPIDPTDLAAALDHIRRIRMPQRETCQYVCVMASAGGAGATTLATNLAVELAAVVEDRCALIDLDLEFPEVAAAYDFRPSHSIMDLLGSDAEVDRMLIEQAMEHLQCNVSILAGSEGIGNPWDTSPERIQSLLRVVSDMFPFAVLNMPRTLSPLAAEALAVAHRVFIVSQLSVPHLRNALFMHDKLVEMSIPKDAIDLVLNRCDSAFERITIEDVEAKLGRPVYARIPNDYKNVCAARDHGRMLMAHCPTSRARHAIVDIAKRLVREQIGEPSVKPDGGSRLGSLLGLFRKPRETAPQRSEECSCL
ncbi:MAG TPA: response regulator [Phycisphaerae bacterium]|nr:response regulator [Phycisphaerae bacterium]HRY67071.1 response regulator [Phycisphaerae bacterium]HSA29823.1 response regulator [Phycisphaerae bacterium]